MLPLSCWRSTVSDTEVLAAAENCVPLLSVVRDYPRTHRQSRVRHEHISAAAPKECPPHGHGALTWSSEWLGSFTLLLA